MEKIKLLKPLWNHKKDDEMEVSKDRKEFAIRKGYAVALKTRKKADPEAKKRKTKIDPEAENLENK